MHALVHEILHLLSCQSTHVSEADLPTEQKADPGWAGASSYPTYQVFISYMIGEHTAITFCALNALWIKWLQALHIALDNF